MRIVLCRRRFLLQTCMVGLTVWRECNGGLTLVTVIWSHMPRTGIPHRRPSVQLYTAATETSPLHQPTYVHLFQEVMLPLQSSSSTWILVLWAERHWWGRGTGLGHNSIQKEGILEGCPSHHLQDFFRGLSIAETNYAMSQYTNQDTSNGDF